MQGGDATEREPFGYRADPQVPAFPDDKPLILFDGVCVLCSKSARFVLRHDPASRFRLATAQSPLGQALYRHFGLDAVAFDTFLLLEHGRAFQKSDAALRIARRLGWPWAAATLLGILPARWRDRAYDAVARRRYRLFGKRETCYVPRPDQADRFL